MSITVNSITVVGFSYRALLDFKLLISLPLQMYSNVLGSQCLGRRALNILIKLIKRVAGRAVET